MDIPTVIEIRHSTESGKQRLLDLAAKKLEPPPPDKRDPDEIAYEQMLNKVISSIRNDAYQGLSFTDITIGTEQHESVENKRKRVALEKIKSVLREMGYQTSWQHNCVEDDGFNRDHFDRFSISWDPTICWNQFRY